MQILALVRSHFRQLIATYAEVAEVLRDEGRLDEAQALLNESLLRSPDPWWRWRVQGSAIGARGVAASDEALRDLVLSFESLGGAGGCEFGFVQRACGAEPLSLFGWAFVLPERLIAGLGERFAGNWQRRNHRGLLAER